MSEDYKVQPGKAIKQFSIEETIQIEKNWMSIFCKNKQGVKLGAYKWHIFSAGRYPALEGERALQEYQSQSSPDYIFYYPTKHYPRCWWIVNQPNVAYPIITSFLPIWPG